MSSLAQLELECTALNTWHSETTLNRWPNGQSCVRQESSTADGRLQRRAKEPAVARAGSWSDRFAVTRRGPHWEPPGPRSLACTSTAVICFADVMQTCPSLTLILMHWLHQDVYPGLGTRSMWFAAHVSSVTWNSECTKWHIFCFMSARWLTTAKRKIYVQVGNKL